MNITKGRLLQVGAAFFEQELAEQYVAKTLQEPTLEILNKYNFPNLSESFVRNFRRQQIKSDWLDDLLKVSRSASSRLQVWIDSQNTAFSPLSEYRYVDERGRVFKPIPLAAEEDKGHDSELYHQPSIKTGYHETSIPVWMPLFGWDLPHHEITDLIRRGLVYYGEKPWDAIYRKELLEDYDD